MHVPEGLTEAQVRVIVGVLNGKVPVTDLDRLVKDGSPDQMTEDQYKKILVALKGDMDKVVPFVKILQDRRKLTEKSTVTTEQEKT